MKNAKRVKENEILNVSDDFKIKYIKKIEAKNENEIPHFVVEIDFKEDDFYSTLNKYGSIPLPPYINRKAKKEDTDNYQTVFAKTIGSVASPTAGLHFSKELAKDAKEYNFHPTQKIEEQDDGTVLVSFKACGNKEIIWHVFKWGRGCKILEPASLQKDYQKMLAENLENYTSI